MALSTMILEGIKKKLDINIDFTLLIDLFLKWEETDLSVNRYCYKGMRSGGQA